MGQPKKSMESRRSKAGPRIGRILRAFAALIVSVATLLTGTVTAQAAVGNLPGYWFNPTSSGSWYIGYHAAGLGPMGYNGDNPYYCLSAGNPLYNTGTWQEVTDTNSKIAAYMVNKYVGDRSDFTQAAVAYALHAHLDRSDTHFNEMVAAGLEGADINAVAAKANEMWNDAYNNTPTDINASYKYTEGKLKGTVNPGIMNTNKQYVAGVQYTITLNGPAVFDATGTTRIRALPRRRRSTLHGRQPMTATYRNCFLCGHWCPAYGFRRPASVHAKSGPSIQEWDH